MTGERKRLSLGHEWGSPIGTKQAKVSRYRDPHPALTRATLVSAGDLSRQLHPISISPLCNAASQEVPPRLCAMQD